MEILLDSQKEMDILLNEDMQSKKPTAQGDFG